MLLRHLHATALAREPHGEAADWSVTDHPPTAMTDRLAESNRMFATVNRDEDFDPLDYPEPGPRPGGETAAAEKRSENPSAEELVRFFA